MENLDPKELSEFQIAIEANLLRALYDAKKVDDKLLIYIICMALQHIKPALTDQDLCSELLKYPIHNPQKAGSII